MFKNWHLGTNDRLEQIQKRRVPDSYPALFLQHRGGAVGSGAGKAAGVA